MKSVEQILAEISRLSMEHCSMDPAVSAVLHELREFITTPSAECEHVWAQSTFEQYEPTVCKKCNARKYK